MKEESNSVENTKDSVSLYQEACRVLAGGVSRNTVFRRPYPHYVEKASGCYVTDISGVQRIDFANNMASLIHGHAYPPIVDAITEQLKKGTAFTMATEAEIRFARLLCDRVAGLDKIRFVNSGTEAVMAMMKAARAYTGKAKIAKAEGAYHGSYDFAEVSQNPNPGNWGDKDNPVGVPVAHGTPQGVLDNMIIFPFNDIERTLTILDKHAGEIAAVMLDPLPHRIGLIPVAEEFLEAVYQWTRNNNALLLFDEVITFRTAYGGAQAQYCVTPDLTSLGKIIGGGFPGGAFGGNSEVMKVLDPNVAPLLLPHSGTFSANPITMTAGHIAVELFDQKAVDRLNALAEKAKKQIREAIKIADMEACVTGRGSMFRIHLKPEPPTNYRTAWIDAQTTTHLKQLLDYLYDEGMIMINTCSGTLSTVMTEKEIDRLSDAVLNALRKLKNNMKTN